MPCFVNTTYSGNDFSEALSVISSDVIRADKISDDIAVAYMHSLPSYYVIDKVKAKRKILWVHNDYSRKPL